MAALSSDKWHNYANRMHFSKIAFIYQKFEQVQTLLCGTVFFWPNQADGLLHIFCYIITVKFSVPAVNSLLFTLS